jgi:hypothetical protein
MLRHFLLAAIIFSASLKADSMLLNDPIHNKLIDRIVSSIAFKCRLADSTKKELSKYFFDYYEEIKKIRNDPKSERNCFKDTKMIFLNGMKQKFGSNVYNCYKDITSPCFFPNSKKLNSLLISGPDVSLITS